MNSFCIKLKNIVSRIGFIALLVFTGCSKNSSNSNVKPTIIISSLDITQGSFNFGVRIRGNGFGYNVNSEKVFFNGKQATLVTSLDTMIYDYVTLAAGTGPVTFTVNGSTATGPIFTYIPALVVTTFAGFGATGSTVGTGPSPQFSNLSGLTIDKDGNLFATDLGNFLIRKITPQGVVTVFAGSGSAGRADGSATTATFEGPTNITADQQGNLFITDGGAVRKISADGTVSTPLLNGHNQATEFVISAAGIAVDATDNLYVTCQGLDLITPAGVLTSFTSTNFSFATGIIFDNNGNLLVADDNTIWKITMQGLVSKFADAGSVGSTGGFQQGIASNKSGIIYITDLVNRVIKKIGTDGTVSVFAGAGPNAVNSFTDGVASVANFVNPTGITVDTSGNIFIADVHFIRKISFQ